MRDCCQLLIPKEQQLQQQPSNIGTGKSIQPQLKQFNQEKSRNGKYRGPSCSAWESRWQHGQVSAREEVSAHTAFTWQRQLVLSLSFNIVFPELRGRGRRVTSSSLTWVTQWDLLSKNNKAARCGTRFWPQQSQAGAGGSLQAPS